MPTAAKTLSNMTKNMTQEEIEARAEAESGTIPERAEGVKLAKPDFIRSNKAGNAYWNKIKKRMEGLVILDDLDSEMFAGYCAMLARRDQLILLSNKLMRDLGVSSAALPEKKPRKKAAAEDAGEEAESSGADEEPAVLTADQIIEAVSKLDTLTGKLQALERNILTYADKLGLTPSGRVRLAQKRAEAAAAKVEEDGDLYGD